MSPEIARKGPKRSKRYKASVGASESSGPKVLAEAVAAALNSTHPKFDETLDVAIKLGIDTKKSDQVVRGTVLLPHGIGKKVRVLALVKSEKEEEAKKAGADFVGNDDLIKKVAGGFSDFDVVVSTPDMMRDISKLGPILGPKGLMPNPKSGTLTQDVGKAITEVKQGRANFRADAAGIIHAGLGKVSFGAEKLIENTDTFLEALNRSRPTGVKGNFFQTVFLSTTMGPSVQVDISKYL